MRQVCWVPSTQGVHLPPSGGINHGEYRGFRGTQSGNRLTRRYKNPGWYMLCNLQRFLKRTDNFCTEGTVVRRVLLYAGRVARMHKEPQSNIAMCRNVIRRKKEHNPRNAYSIACLITTTFASAEEALHNKKADRTPRWSRVVQGRGEGDNDEKCARRGEPPHT